MQVSDAPELSLHDVRVVVFYPWPGLPAMDRGAARRVVPMLTLLAKHCRAITVLSPGAGPTQKVGNVSYAFHAPAPLEKLFAGMAWMLFDGVTHHVWRGRTSVRERRQWWHYWHPVLLPSLSKAMRELCIRADVVLLEYPFWSRVLQRAMPQKDVPVILTMHDLLSDAIAQPWLKRRVRSLEMAACRRAQAVACHAQSDQEKLAADGITSRFIPPGIDLNPAQKAGHAADFPSALVRLEEHLRNGGLTCLFVGSSLQPNQEAVDVIACFARHLRDEPKLLFVVAGACCGAMTLGENFIALGPVSEPALECLYALCDVALAPVTSGTGSSLKVLEALARGRVLVATSCAVRGYAIVSGRHGILCDDLSFYPELLRGLLRDSGQRKKLAAAGESFARSFDSRTAYRPYADLICQVLPNPEKLS